MKFSYNAALRTLLSPAMLAAFTLAGCAGGHQPIPLPAPDSVHRSAVREAAAAQGAADSTGMCPIYAGFGTLSFCYDMNEASGTTLIDGSSAGHNGTLSPSGITYRSAALTSNASYAETTNGSSGSMTSGFSPGSGSFSISFFVTLRSNGNNFSHLAATGNPGNGSPSNGWNIVLDENGSNTVFAKFGYGSGQTTLYGVPLALNTPSNVTLTYNSGSRTGTLCVGNSSTPSCTTGNLPAAYVASGNPVVFGGGDSYAPANASFDEAAYWQGTALSSSQIDTIAGYSSVGMCSVYAGFGAPSFCYNMDQPFGTTLTDSSGAGHSGTISSSGVGYHTAALTTNSSFSLTTNGSSGSMTSGFAPSAGSFSLAFFVDLLSNAGNFGRLVATGAPCNGCNPSSGFTIDLNSTGSNDVFAKFGNGNNETTLDGVSLPVLSSHEGVVLTYNSGNRLATLCVGASSQPACVTGTLPSAYVASGSPIVFGGGTAYAPQNANFADAAYWQGTVLNSAQIGAITAYAGGSGSPTPGPTPKPTSPPTGSPTPSPKPTGSSLPTPRPGSSAYAPPAGTVPYFKSAIFNNKIPNPPTVNPSNGPWVASLNQGGNFSLNTINVSSYEPNIYDHQYTVYYNHSGSNTPVKIHCSVQYAKGVPCNDEGMTVYIDSREKVQNNDANGQDDHFVLIDPVEGYEYVFWVVQPPFPPTNGVLTARYSGRCSLSGDGFTNPSYSGPPWNVGCVGDEVGQPLSMGMIRPEDIMAALNSSTGSLPQAISFGITCPGRQPGTLPPPFLGTGSGTCDPKTHAIEGNRLYLAMHDSDVNALHLPKITSVMLRTLDEDHFGGFVADTGGTQPGLQMYSISSNSYLSWGQADPWTTQFLPEARAEGLPGTTGFGHSGVYQVQLPIPSSITSKVRFL